MTKGKSVSTSTSATFHQMGLVDALKARSDLVNFKDEAAKAMGSGDQVGYVVLSEI
jgi:hypothetical protein